VNDFSFPGQPRIKFGEGHPTTDWRPRTHHPPAPGPWLSGAGVCEEAAALTAGQLVEQSPGIVRGFVFVGPLPDLSKMNGTGT
jgi:hypothetical protein